VNQKLKDAIKRELTGMHILKRGGHGGGSLSQDEICLAIDAAIRAERQRRKVLEEGKS